jgi:hypothetical protein
MDACKKGIVYLALFLSNLILIADSAALPLPPRLAANAYASDYTVGQADLMLSVIGDTQHNFYLDPVVSMGSDNQGYADLGLGYRWINNNVAILGLYVFGGYTRIDNNARLWVANPAIEALGSRWDAHLNAYFPMGIRNKLLAESSSVAPLHKVTGLQDILRFLILSFIT